MGQVLFIYKMIRLVLKWVQEQIGIWFLKKMCVDKYVDCKVYLYHKKDFVFMMILFSLQQLWLKLLSEWLSLYKRTCSPWFRLSLKSKLVRAFCDIYKV